ncbi:endoribonuclease MazF [Patescibacteria group bacterium]|nr:endoribonuclease MazF [Patescibacteria group bacterium]MBU1754783.1 endoribonuclease MazF [Patescibacteria group bacterium]
MVAKKYTPDAGDVVWVTLDPTVGHEQKGRRPAYVLTPALYNAKTGMALMAPITSVIKGYPFEVVVHAGAVEGAILTDQLRSIDWKSRNVVHIDTVGQQISTAVRRNVAKLIGA